MSGFLVRRFFSMLLIMVFISIIAFVIIQLPPGDYLTHYISTLERTGIDVSDQMINGLKEEYGLGQPLYIQYFKWITGFVQGDMGQSFQWKQPVNELVFERLGFTLVVTLSSLLFTWIIAFPVGIYAALNQYSIGDYLSTFFSFIGLATPNFMLALILMYIGYSVFGIDVGGLFSPEYQDAACSFGKVIDLLQHLWVPMVVVGTAGTAGLVRIMRANLLDELQKNYVTTARAKGVAKRKMILKYPVRIALNPFISTVGWTLPRLISGATITSVVLNLPTTGPLLLSSLKSQDMYLAGSFVLLLSILTVIGTFISDILLALVDPRIRYE
jgi:peptide/nickel transport system permease protein